MAVRTGRKAKPAARRSKTSRASTSTGAHNGAATSSGPVVQPPIGVFDSGIGGLTVAAAMREILPAENIFYLGDTARVPYGGKSRETIERYSREIGGMLVTEDAKVIVVACNTASALGIPAMREKFATPIIGVIEPGARAAVEATKSGRIGVIGTRATIYSRAYERAIQSLDRDVQVISAPCPLFVPMIEEGWLDDGITDQVIRRYIEPLIREEIDTLVLGCTHYPLLRDSLQRFVGSGITLVDSAHNCALAVKELLKSQRLGAAKSNIGRLTVALTDHSTPFLRVAEEALGLQVGDVQLRQVQGAVA
jgi:glutamate racemase